MGPIRSDLQIHWDRPGPPDSYTQLDPRGYFRGLAWPTEGQTVVKRRSPSVLRKQMLYSQTSHLVSKATQKTLWQRLSQVMSAGCQSTWFAFLFKSPSFSTHPPHRLAPVPPPPQQV